MDLVALKQPHKDWLEGRGIDPVLAEKFGLDTVLLNDRNWLSVPYKEHGRVLNHKYRVISDKTLQRMDTGAPLILLNHDCLLDESLASTPLVITEGEWDLLSVLSAGKRRVVSVPNGAPKEASDDEALKDGTRYAWFWRHRDILANVKQVILCVDADEPGKALAADLCRLFGPERCMFVEYPEGCKDANDVVNAYSYDALVEMLDKAKPYPVKGLYQIDDFPEQPAYRSFKTDLYELDELMRIVPRTFTVVTGFAGNGKTSFLMWIIAGLIMKGVHVTVASFETDIKPIFHRKLVAALLRTGEYTKHEPEQQAWAENLIRKHLAIISHSPDDDEESLSAEDVIELAKASVARNSTRVLIVDPWNELDHKRSPHENETDYTGRAIRAFKRFAKNYDVSVWVIAHPSKPYTGPGRPKMPGLYDISGSAHWANKADYGIVFQIKDREMWTTTILVAKVRMGLPGKMGSAVLQFDPNRSTYRYYAPVDSGASESVEA
jgi:twinkle protein